MYEWCLEKSQLILESFTQDSNKNDCNSAISFSFFNASLWLLLSHLEVLDPWSLDSPRVNGSVKVVQLSNCQRKHYETWRLCKKTLWNWIKLQRHHMRPHRIRSLSWNASNSRGEAMLEFMVILHMSQKCLLWCQKGHETHIEDRLNWKHLKNSTAFSVQSILGS